MADEKLVIDVIARDKASREFDKVGDAAVKTSKDFDKAADAAGKLGEEFGKTSDKAKGAGEDFDRASKGAGKLQAQIDQTAITLRELGREFDKTGDKALLKDIGRERRTLAGLTKLRKEMAGFADDIGDVARASARIGVSTGQGLFAGISGAFGPKGTTAITTGLVGAAVAASPAIAAVVTGAIGGAIGSGAVAAGIASAAQSNEVKSAWQKLANEGKSAFTSFGQPFIEPTVDAINLLRSGLADVGDDLDDIADSASRFVQPLARGLVGLVREAMPGLRSMMRDLQPIFDVLGDELPDLGKALDSFFESIGDGADGGAEALRDLLETTEKVIVATGEVLEFFGKHYEDFKHTLMETSGLAGDVASVFLELFGDKPQAQIKAAGKASDDTFKSIFDGAKEAAEQVERLNQKFDDLFDKTMDLDQANIDYQLGLIELGETLKHNNETISDGTERQLRNRDAVLGMIDEVKGLRDATIAMGDGTQASTNKANAAYLSQLQKIREVAVAFGFPIGQIDALIARYAALAAAPNITKFVTIKYNTSGAPAAKPGQLLFEAKGGIVAAQHGMVTSSPTVLFGERQTGQEAFIPKLGISRDRGLALASQAAAWHGGSVVPNGRMGGGGIGPLVLNYSAGGSGLDDMFVKWLHQQIREGKIQLSAGGSRVAVG